MRISNYLNDVVLFFLVQKSSQPHLGGSMDPPHSVVPPIPTQVLIIIPILRFSNFDFILERFYGICYC